MVKKFSNAQEVNIFSSSNVNFYTILSHVLDSDSEIMKMSFSFFRNLTSSHHFLPGHGLCILRVARLPTQSTTATKQSRGNTVF